QETNWQNLHRYGLHGRKLVVIDEALDIIEEAQIDLGNVRLVKAVVPQHVQNQFPVQMNAIQALEDLLVQVDRRTTEMKEAGSAVAERITWRNEGPIKLPDSFDMTPLRRALKGLRLDLKLARKSDQKTNLKLIKEYDETLKHIQQTLANWNWFA